MSTNHQYETICQIKYRNTIASSSPGERVFICFCKKRFAFQIIDFLNFCFYSKKSLEKNVNGLEITTYCKNYFFCLHKFTIFMFLIFRIIFERSCYGITVTF